MKDPSNEVISGSYQGDHIQSDLLLQLLKACLCIRSNAAQSCLDLLPGRLCRCVDRSSLVFLQFRQLRLLLRRLALCGGMSLVLGGDGVRPRCVQLFSRALQFCCGRIRLRQQVRCLSVRVCCVQCPEAQLSAGLHVC